MHRIAEFALAFAMAIPRCQWRHRCVVTLGNSLVVLYSKPLWRKGKMEAKAERRCARCKTLSRAIGQGTPGQNVVRTGLIMTIWSFWPCLSCLEHRIHDFLVFWWAETCFEHRMNDLHFFLGGMPKFSISGGPDQRPMQPNCRLTVDRDIAKQLTVRNP